MSEHTIPIPFSLGEVVMTRGALQAFQDAHLGPEEFLARHAVGDWGEVGPGDWEENELSLREGFRVLSAHTLSTSVKIWIITEADRSVTTILLPEEY